MDLQLRALRRAHDMTQGELAAAIGTTLRVVSTWERGETALSLEDAVRIADVLGCSLDELAGRVWHGHATDGETELVACYRSATPRQRSTILEVAATFRDGGRAKNGELRGAEAV